jgi:hypothetical protein
LLSVSQICVGLWKRSIYTIANDELNNVFNVLTSCTCKFLRILIHKTNPILAAFRFISRVHQFTANVIDQNDFFCLSLSRNFSWLSF